MKRKAFTLIELLIVCALAFLLLAAVLTLFSGGCSRSEGNRVGTVTKFSYKGVFNSTKSYEGELVMGGMRSSTTDKGVSTLTANVWDFSVVDPAVAKQIEALQDSGHRAKLHYTQSLTHNPFTRDTSYIVTSATDLDTNAPPEPK
jgi:type II secretory pathway pseudopilin PulG